MKKHNPAFFQVSLKVLLKNKTGKTLLLQSVPKDRWKSRSDLPGGRINGAEINRSLQAILKREITEELGRSVRYELNPRPVSVDARLVKRKGHPEICRFHVLFDATYLGGPIRISAEHAGYQWTKLTSRTVTRNFVPLLNRLLQNYLIWNDHA